MKIIGFIGPKGSGKDTAAGILVKAKKARNKLSFAGPLKEICSEVFDISLNNFNDPALKELPLAKPIQLNSRVLRQVKIACAARLPEIDPETEMFRYVSTCPINGVEHRICKTPRELLQIIGTDLIRKNMYKDWHLEAAFSDLVLGKLAPSATYCVTDIRFPNELELLQNKFGDAFTAYYVERPEAEKALEESTHESEKNVIVLRSMIGDKNVLKNTKGLKEFEKAVKENKQLKAFLASDADFRVSSDNKTSDGTIRSGKFVYGPKGR